jgi:hypothetical protein
MSMIWLPPLLKFFRENVFGGFSINITELCRIVEAIFDLQSFLMFSQSTLGLFRNLVFLRPVFLRSVFRRLVFRRLIFRRSVLHIRYFRRSVGDYCGIAALIYTCRDEILLDQQGGGVLYFGLNVFANRSLSTRVDTVYLHL